MLLKQLRQLKFKWGEVKPYFRDIYFAPSYESRYDDVIFPLKMRYGKNIDNGRAQVYGFLNLNRDTQSQGGVRPEIIDENAATLGWGKLSTVDFHSCASLCRSWWKL